MIRATFFASALCSASWSGRCIGDPGAGDAHDGVVT